MDIPLRHTQASISSQAHAPSRTGAASRTEIRQYSRRAILAIWAAAAAPMAALSWLVAPAVANRLSGEGNVPMGKALLAVLTIGLIWQFVLVAILLWREQRTFRWSTVREALWLRSPQSPRSGRVGGRLWLIVLPLLLAYAAVPFAFPGVPSPDARDFEMFLSSEAGQSFMSGNWGWYGLMIVLWVFNTVLGEELLFRGFLLPRMNGAFGRLDWLVNGALFAAYHLHVPWVIPETLLADTLIVAYPSKRYRSAWIGIAVHSAQSVVLAVIVLTLVI
jgi:membrane protease YdiL (CAAX protease family)